VTLQKRLKKIMRKNEWRVADLARALGRPYTTVREWVLFGREPSVDLDMQTRLYEIER